MPFPVTHVGNIWRPEKSERELAKKASGELDSIYGEILAHNLDPQTFFEKLTRAHISIPPMVITWMLQVLKEVALGNAVTLIPIHAELTTQEAADFLSVSRPYFVSLLENGSLPFRKVGRHRRVRFGDIYEYKLKNEQERQKTLKEMASQSQDLEGDNFDLEDLKD